jgi:hypothetical protein
MYNAYTITYRTVRGEAQVGVVAPTEPAAVDALWEARRVRPEAVTKIESRGAVIVYGQG